MRQLKRHRLKLLALCGVVGTVGSGAATLVLAASLWASAVVMVSVAGLAVIGLYIAWQLERRANLELRQLKQMREMMVPMRDELSRISYRTAPLRDLAGSVVKLRRDVDALPDRIRVNVDYSEEMQASPVGEGGPFSPQLIPAFKPAAPSPGVSAGRFAAARADDPDSPEKFAALIGDPHEAPVRPAVLAVTTPEFATRIDVYADVTKARPETAALELKRDFAYLVVDDAAFECGPWFGADSAENSVQYLNLRDLIGTANGQGLLTVLISRTGRANHFTAELHQLCRIVINKDFAEANGDGAVPSVVLNLVDDCEFRSSAR